MREPQIAERPHFKRPFELVPGSEGSPWTPVGPGWFAAALAWTATSGLLVAAGVGLLDIVVFTIYASLVVALPGTLLWRLTIPGRRPLGVDVVLGTTLGLALEIFAYLPARSASVPLAYLAVPAAVVVLSVVLPGWRRRCWHRPAARLPTAVSWAWSAAAVMTSLSCARLFWFTQPITGVARRYPYVDQPYHLSLVGELRHHVPSEVPFVRGEPLFYHWFFHADVAAASWATGIEPLVLVQRLSPLLMSFIALLGAGAAAWWLARSWTAAAVAPLLLAVASGSIVPPGTNEFFLAVLFPSPTTTLAQAVVPATIVLVCAALRGSARGGAWWVPLILVLGVAAGAKGTGLPIVALALVAVAVLSLRSREAVLRAAAIVGVCIVLVLLAQTYVYGRESQGLVPSLVGSGQMLAENYGLVQTDTAAGATVTTALALRWVIGWCASAVFGFILMGPGTWRDPAYLFLVMATGAGIGGFLVFAADGGNQLYFVRVVPVFAAVAASIGLSLVIAAGRRVAVIVGASTVVGAAIAWFVGLTMALPVAEPNRVTANLVQAMAPAAVVLGAIGFLAVLAGTVLRRDRWSRWFAATVLAALMGTSLVVIPVQTSLWIVSSPDAKSWEPFEGSKPKIGIGGIRAAKWVRTHSSPDDRIATNQHCMVAERYGSGCDNRSFWISAYSERRVLLEGWAYTSRTGARALESGAQGCCLPYWDQTMLAQNDKAIMAPSRGRLQRLRADYDVRWLFVSTIHGDGWRRLESMPDLVRERFRSGAYVVFELH